MSGRPSVPLAESGNPAGCHGHPTPLVLPSKAFDPTDALAPGRPPAGVRVVGAWSWLPWEGVFEGISEAGGKGFFLGQRRRGAFAVVWQQRLARRGFRMQVCALIHGLGGSLEICLTIQVRVSLKPA